MRISSDAPPTVGEPSVDGNPTARICGPAGATGSKGSMDPSTGQELLDLIAEIDKIFWETKQG